ncbi:MAG TPA: hypothetical protein VK154_13965, partial [Chitinophagales bacterium]|nr:hypothetical protein [Chitinophagales bacterium]
MKQQPTKRVLSTEEVTLINERADAVFKAHPTVEQLYACIDGQLFFTKEKNAAENHARKLKQAELILVTKSEVGSPKTEV